ncbi:conserved hypothetical protein [Hyphomicrobiales bacterium]|nr:conserved hypothetical protein [Hyphomicrobiales bacterium]CAH1698726.1 conserved hypothetical protein [Hyphomicrobiales bacterium]CAI0342374.1 conserved hypothetical protein [Hyphomicrobiales bacterium]
MTRPLSEADKRDGFIRAINGYSGAKQRWADRAARGMSDAELAEALAFELGIFGGSGGPDQLSLTFQGAGLKIWISWKVHNHVTTKPTFEGKGTIAFARLVYGIKDPADRQLALF